jgi:hypothetical protein
MIGLVTVVVGGVGLAGCHRPTLVEGAVWFDVDFDGVRDPDEAPAAGVEVRVTCHYTNPAVFADGQCDTATTDTDGAYTLFVPVDRRGETQAEVSFVAPAGSEAVEPPDVDWFLSLTHPQQRDFDGIDAALVSTDVGNLGDLVWLDDGDGIQDSGEPGVAGIAVELQVGLGVVVANTVTGPDGRYLFEAVEAGRYTVRFGPLPAGLRFTDDGRGPDDTDSDANPYSGRASAVVAAGEALLGVDAGLVPAEPGELGHVGDRVWTDIDGDGLQDPGEPGEAGVEVALVGANTGQLASTVTDAAGAYSFMVSRAIAPDQPYRLVFAAPPGRTFSPLDAGDDAIDSDADPETGDTVNFRLGPDETVTTWDAGIAGSGPPGAIGDLVWEDLDGDGTQGADEPGVPTVIVELLDASGTVLSTLVTETDGQYRFSGLAGGDYSVRFDAPPGFGFTAPDQGNDDQLDSDADPATGQTPTLSLADGELDLSVDAGLRALPSGPATIGDLAWRDLDRDGLQEPGEPGLANVTVRLLDQQGAIVATTTTDSGGIYGFTNVAPGTYRVRFVSPAGLMPTTADAGTDDTVDSDINGGGETPLLTITAGQTDITIDAGFTILA